MRATNHLLSSVVVVTALLLASEVHAQSRELDNVPSPHKIPSPQVQAAYNQAKQGHMHEAIESLRVLAKKSAENSLYLGLLLFAWRQQLVREGIEPIPPVDWEMDWLRCAALMASDDDAQIPAVLAEYYSADTLVEKLPSGVTLRLPGPGKSGAFEHCWASVSEGATRAQDCIDKEQELRDKRKLPALVCPPNGPTKADIAKYPAVKLAD